MLDLTASKIQIEKLENKNYEDIKRILYYKDL